MQNSKKTDAVQHCLERYTEERPSIISLFFDQLNFKGLLKGIFKKTPIKVTDQFIDAILLFIFLGYIFYTLGVLTLWSSYTILLVFIGLLAFLEFVGINTPWLKKFFTVDVRTKMFLEKVPSMTKREIEEEIKLINFSSTCMNFFLHSLERENNKFSPYFVDLVVDTQLLRKENLDLLFSPAVISYIRPNTMIKVLFKNRDFLTQENIQNIYNHYKNNKNNNIIKILIATQKDSHSLFNNSFGSEGCGKNIDDNFPILYQTYHEEEKHLDWILKIIPLSKFRTIRNYLLWISFITFLYIYIKLVENGSVTLSRPEDIIGIFIASLFLTAIVIHIIVDPILIRTNKFYFERFIHKVINL